MYVKPKKHLGQHFLKDESVCVKMVAAVPPSEKNMSILEIGPGTGALTKYLLKRTDFDTHVIELDSESVQYLQVHYEQLAGKIYYLDFLKVDLSTLMGTEPFLVFGNFPYNISSQILFKVLDYKDQIPMVVGMFQKEVAERIATPPGSKQYGIISVLLQAFYDIEYLFTVNEDVFDPPPKVKSGVIKLVRNSIDSLGCDERDFKRVVKTAFQQRRKTLRNSLKSMIGDHVDTDMPIFRERPEQLSVDDFVELTVLLLTKE
ncbi:MAG: 16S rRNA (adenine(1518)-N(6)/adenine(1519)-N(6))-dimethyltransferase RsmA [Putridiphycobacter sp.]|nr:16S rRNA (adenine(1518)-N(6)/adenine(1519)-N(6))-dimethyltransferase RsmA [Putridiphycobacter sp.]